MQQESVQRQSSSAAKASLPETDAKRQSHTEEEAEEEEEAKEDQQRKTIEEEEEEKESAGAEVQDVTDGRLSLMSTTSTTGKALFTLEDIESSSLLQISRLNEWDFPIFELAEQEKTFVLSKVSRCRHMRQP